MRIFKQVTRFDFLGKRRGAWMLSAVLLAASIGSLGVRGLNFGIDFTGGTLVELEYLEKNNFSPVQIVQDLYHLLSVFYYKILIYLSLSLLQTLHLYTNHHDHLPPTQV